MTTTLEGFDISHYQTITDAELAKVATGRYWFGGLKASEGSYQTDPTFHDRRQVLRAAAFPRRVYHEATSEGVSPQLYRIMSATGGFLYPRERLMIVLGDFSVQPAHALDLLAELARRGPVKRARTDTGHTTAWRPAPIVYANRSLWQTVYTAPGFHNYPKEVAAYPGDGSEFTVTANVVFHQDSNHDQATGGDHVVANPSFSAADLLAFFRR